jgi:hypothetical protein
MSTTAEDRSPGQVLCTSSGTPRVAHDRAGRRVRSRRTWVGRQRPDREGGTCGANALARTTAPLRRDRPVRGCGARDLERGKRLSARRAGRHVPITADNAPGRLRPARCLLRRARGPRPGSGLSLRRSGTANEFGTRCKRAGLVPDRPTRSLARSPGPGGAYGGQHGYFARRAVYRHNRRRARADQRT